MHRMRDELVDHLRIFPAPLRVEVCVADHIERRISRKVRTVSMGRLFGFQRFVLGWRWDGGFRCSRGVGLSVRAARQTQQREQPEQLNNPSREALKPRCKVWFASI